MEIEIDKRSSVFRALTIEKDVQGYKPFWVFGEPHIYCRRPHINWGVMDEAYIQVDTLGEYTRLKDRNGKECFEGDIIRYYDLEYREVCDGGSKNVYDEGKLPNYEVYIKEVYDEVVFKNGAFCLRNGECNLLWFLTQDGRGELIEEEVWNDVLNKKAYPQCRKPSDLNLFEVVGNIHEDPKLLVKVRWNYYQSIITE